MNTWRMVATPILVLLLAVMAPIAMAQLPGLSSAGDAPAAEPTDPMGRGTPRGTIVAFSRAAQREDFIAAARYLQLQGSQRLNVTMLVTALRTVIDRDLHEALASISDAPAGSLDDGLPEDQEHIGPLVLEGGKFCRPGRSRRPASRISRRAKNSWSRPCFDCVMARRSGNCARYSKARAA